MKKRGVRQKNKSNQNSHNYRSILAIAFILLILIFGYYLLNINELVGQATSTLPSDSIEVTPSADFDGYIVELQTPPLLEVAAPLEQEIDHLEEQIELIEEKIMSAQGTQQTTLERGKDILIAHKAEEIQEQEVILENHEQRLDQEQEAFKVSLAPEAGLFRSAPPPKLVVEESFSIAVNALVVDGSESDIEVLKNNPSVKRITPNYRMKALLGESVPQIQNGIARIDADGGDCQTSGKPCLTGQGIRIGIIDTGIDYEHPDFGSCTLSQIKDTDLNTCPKIAGGFDFLNNDADPMDDDGHGTHVAATAAGNGPVFTGVAPDATLFIYKVLGPNGGLSSHTIAAIERSFDLDGDKNIGPAEDKDSDAATSSTDKLDIISLSLGSEGNADDPTSTAIDNAVRAGVIAVAAAGNEGPTERTINSPGTARLAITVGAVNKQDQLADFSSRGPTSTGFKPDILAPGVAICAAQWSRDTAHNNQLCDKDPADSNLLDGFKTVPVTTRGHIAIQGTSMATPHVSGAAALLKQKHPDWTPGEIKAAFKLMANNLGLKNIEQGSGRINVIDVLRLSNPPPVAELVLPSEVRGSINILGSVHSRDFKQYQVFITSRSAPLITATAKPPAPVSPLVSSVLLQGFDSSAFSDGDYVIKLVVENNNANTVGTKEGRISQDEARIHINNFEILSPGSGEVVRAGDTIPIQVRNDILSIQSMEWGEGNQPTSWNAVQLSGNLIGTFKLADFVTPNTAQATGFTVSVRVRMQNQPEFTEQVTFYLDPTIRPAWPKKYSAAVDCNEPTIGCKHPVPLRNYPLIADVDNDGTKEIVIPDNTPTPLGTSTDSSNFIHAYKHDGTESPWPIMAAISASRAPQFSRFGTAISSINGKKIIIDAQTGWLFDGSFTGSGNGGFDGSFSSTKGILDPINSVKFYGTGELINYFLQAKSSFACPSSFDVNGDGKNEILILSRSPTDTNKLFLHVFDYLPGDQSTIQTTKKQGVYLPGWPQVVKDGAYNSWIPNACPTKAGDNIIVAIPESVTGVPGVLKSFNSDGSIQWEKPGNFFDVAVGNVHGDAQEEIIVTAGSSGSELSTEVHVYNLAGNLLWQQPLDAAKAKGSKVAIADVNNDNTRDIVTIDKIFNGDGIVLHTLGVKNPTNPPSDVIPVGIAVADIAGDNNKEVLYILSESAEKSGAKSYISAVDLGGNIVPSFPKQMRYPAYNYPYFSTDLAVSDLDNDGKMELIAADAGYVYVWNLAAGSSTTSSSCTPDFFYLNGQTLERCKCDASGCRRVACTGAVCPK